MWRSIARMIAPGTRSGNTKKQRTRVSERRHSLLTETGTQRDSGNSETRTATTPCTNRRADGQTVCVLAPYRASPGEAKRAVLGATSVGVVVVDARGVDTPWPCCLTAGETVNAVQEDNTTAMVRTIILHTAFILLNRVQATAAVQPGSMQYINRHAACALCLPKGYDNIYEYILNLLLLVMALLYILQHSSVICFCVFVSRRVGELKKQKTSRTPN